MTTDRDTLAAEWRHVRNPYPDVNFCLGCSEPWPCSSQRTLTRAILAANVTLAPNDDRLRAALEEVERRRANEVALNDPGQYSMGRQSAYNITLGILRAALQSAQPTPEPTPAGLDVLATVATVRAVLEREGIDEPERGIHSWRCAHPDRYGKCKCLDVVMEDIAAALATTTEPQTTEDALIEADMEAAFLHEREGGALER